jgi:hypothetical protein
MTDQEVLENINQLFDEGARAWFTVHLPVQGVTSRSRGGAGTLMASPLRRVGCVNPDRARSAAAACWSADLLRTVTHP